MKATTAALCAAALVTVTAGVASAGTISGTITAQAGGAPIASAEVRIWQNGVKGWTILQTVAANASGGYAFTVPAGGYLVDCRGPAGSGANYGDRWYDVAAPTSGGYVGENADVVNVTANGTTANINIAMEVVGGADGTLMRAGNVVQPNAFVRMERRGEVRIHHNTVSSPSGLTSFRGLVPAADYQIIAYDPAGVRDTLLVGGPFGVTSNTNGALGTLTMADHGADPYEGNNGAVCGTGFDAAPLHQDPPVAWQSNPGARIGPLASGDVDWFCFNAVAGDRMFVTASTAFTFAGATRYHPWTDPMISFWRGARVTKLAEDDDSGTGPLDARLDTGPLTAGCHCIAVTSFGDAGYVGASQGSTGRYTLRVAMGNRPPVVSIRKGASELPVAPAIVYLDEGDTLSLTLGYADADHDVPTRSFAFADRLGAAVAGGMLDLGATGGTYVWTAPPGSQDGSPYSMRLTAADGEFTMRKDVVVVVNGVNRAPATPVLSAPVGGAVVATGAPVLTWTNAADPEGEAVTYDVELYADETDALPLQTASVPADPSGTTTWTPATIAENTRASWRVRARDGHPNGFSPWSGFATFLVDVQNDPPEVPVLIKPASGELVPVRRPGLSVLETADPEDDDISMVFELALDEDFTSGLWTSDPVPMNPMTVTTMAATGVDLAWGTTYYARVRAGDDRGAVSEWSEVHRFQTTRNLAPTTPMFAEACVASIYKDAAPTAIVVTNVVDPEHEAVELEVQFFTYDTDPETGIPVYRTRAPMDTTSTTTAIPIDLSSLPNGQYRYRVRAHDGTDPSDWIGCELTLELVTDDGGCCDARTGPAGAAAPLLLGLVGLGLVGRRRRRA